MAYRGGGSKPGERRGGRKAGSKNKATVERERQAVLDAERAVLIAKADEAKSEVLAAQASGKKLMKEIGFEFAQLFAGRAAFHQPYPTAHLDPATGRMVNDNPNYDEALFREYSTLAVETAAKFAGYESPKLSAVMVGAAVVNEVNIKGGMPDDFSAPAGVPAEQLPAGTTVEAEDDYVSPVAPAA